MPRETDLGTPEDWLRHARSDLSVAVKTGDPDTMLETLGYHAQQAVEKSIKGVLLAREVEFPYTHNIARLITILKESGIAWPEEFSDAAGLTELAVETRYPGMYVDISEEEYEGAVEMARRVLAWAERTIAAGNVQGTGKAEES